VFDGNIFGYMFKNIADETVLDISTMVKIVNKDFVIANKKQLIKDKCVNGNDGLKTIDFSKVSFTDPYFLMVSVEGESKNKKDCVCDVTFDLRNEWTPTAVQFTVK